jgi:hypothetical protein
MDTLYQHVLRNDSSYKQITITDMVGFTPNINQLWYLFCSHNFDKLASPGYVLLSPCGIMYEAL